MRRSPAPAALTLVEAASTWSFRNIPTTPTGTVADEPGPQRQVASEEVLHEARDVPTERRDDGGEGPHVQRDVEGEPASRTPRTALPRARCPELLTGRNSVSP